MRNRQNVKCRLQKKVFIFTEVIKEITEEGSLICAETREARREVKGQGYLGVL